MKRSLADVKRSCIENLERAIRQCCDARRRARYQRSLETMKALA